MVAKDFLGNSLAVGDRVIYTALRYRNLTFGYVMKITPKFVQIGKTTETDQVWWIKQAHTQVIKYE